MATYTAKKIKITQGNDEFICDPISKLTKNDVTALGIPELGNDGKILSSQLPSYVDDVIDGYLYDGKFYEESTHTTEITPESGKVYVDLSTDKTYRWSGSAYVVIGSDLALGETSSTAYRGDRGAAAYAAAVTNVESTPSSGSSNLITSGAVYAGLDDKAPKASPVFTGSISLGRKANTTVGSSSVAFGLNAEASAEYTFAQGRNVKATVMNAHAEGNGATASAYSSHAEGEATKASGYASHAEGSYTTASGYYAHAEGVNTIASGDESHAEGIGGTNYGALGKADHAEGYQTKADSGSNSSSYGAHSEGYRTSATAKSSHAEGSNTVASNNGSHAEGYNTTASGENSHAEGYHTNASGNASHAEGYFVTSSAAYAHAEGYYTTASGVGSHAEGNTVTASGQYSHAEGYHTNASGSFQHVVGVYNYAEPDIIRTIPDISEVEEYDTNKKFYPRGSIAKVSNTIWVAHDNAPVVRSSPKYDTYNWHSITTLPSGTIPEEWQPATAYAINTYVKLTDSSGAETYYQNHYALSTPTIVPGVDNDYSMFWHTQSSGTVPYLNAIEIVGNGSNNTEGRNIRMLDIYGNEYLIGDIYVGCNADSSGGTKLTAPVAMTGADGTNAGTAGYAPAPSATDNTKYLKGDGTWADVDALPAVTSSDNGKSLEVVSGSWAVGSEKIDKYYDADDWSAKTWTGLTSFSGSFIWTDGENIYFSNASNQYVLDTSTSTWSTKAWTGLTSFNGDCVWTDGENIYYSNSSTQRVLDKSTSTWTTKTWTELISFTRYYIWTDGTNIYFSDGYYQFVLDKSTSTWSEKTWTGLTNFNGHYVWTDGDNIYYSSGSTQYVLNKSTSTWSTKTWAGMSNFSGDNIWTDGENIYYSDGTSQYVLNKSTSTWTVKIWTGLTIFTGNNIWTDGENLYYSESTTHYKLLQHSPQILLGRNGEFSAVDANGIILPSVSASDNGKILKVASGAWSAETPDSGLPSAPVSDGTYFLQCVVSSGTPTYSWVTIPAANGVSF